VKQPFVFVFSVLLFGLKDFIMLIVLFPFSFVLYCSACLFIYFISTNKGVLFYFDVC